MPWYQPVVDPPLPHRRLRPEDDDGPDRRNGNLFDADTGEPIDGRNRRSDGFGGRLDDELQTRIENLLSPMLRSSSLVVVPTLRTETGSTAAASPVVFARGGREENRPSHPHPSFRHRETPPPNSARLLVEDDPESYFFYPRPLSGRRRRRSSFYAEEGVRFQSQTTDAGTQRSSIYDDSRSERIEEEESRRRARHPHVAGSDRTDVQEFRSQRSDDGIGSEKNGEGGGSLCDDDGSQHRPADGYETSFDRRDGDRFSRSDPFALSAGDGRPERKRSQRQTTLAQDPNTGNIFASSTPPPPNDDENERSRDQSWAGVGDVGAWREPTGDDGNGNATADGKKRAGKKKKQRSKTKKKKKDDERSVDIAAMLSGRSQCDATSNDEEGAGADSSSRRRRKDPPPPDDDDSDDDDDAADFEEKRKKRRRPRKKTKEVQKRKKERAPAESSKPPTHPREEPPPPEEHDSTDDAFDLSAFAGIEECGICNAGASSESLREFRRFFLSRKYVTWTTMFLDKNCTTPFLPSCKKYCTEKGPRCTNWNCTCDDQVRASRSCAPVLGAMFVFPVVDDDDVSNDDDDESLSCFVLPLGPTMNSDRKVEAIDPGYERMGRWPTIPFACDTSLQDRWDMFASILKQNSTRCVTYNAIVGLLPFHYHREHDAATNLDGIDGGVKKSNATELLVPSVWDLRLASWMLTPHATEEELEFDSVRAGFAHLRPSASSSSSGNSAHRRRPAGAASTQLSGLLEAKDHLEFLFALYPVIDRLLDEKGLRSSFDDIEGPLISVLSAMECTGIGFLPDTLLGVQRQLEKKIDELTAEARFISKDSTFLLSSPQQVSHLLFDVMKIAPPKNLSSKTVAGSQHRSTSEEALRSIQKNAGPESPHRIVDILLEFRNLNKLLTTYVRPLPRFSRTVVASETTRRRTRSKKKRSKKSAAAGRNEGDETNRRERIHPMWMQTAVRTGRLSCRKPNMQQIPTEGAFGVNPRDAFAPSSSDKCLFAFDYSQNEVRILAHMSDDEALVSMFRNKGGVDIYKQMASAVSGKPVDDVTGKERAISKQVTLAILYGMGVPQVAKKLGVSRDAAQKFFSDFFRRFRGVKRWIESTKEFARRHKYVSTIAGRRRYLDDITSPDNGKRAQAERQAVNTIIQGSAADLMKLAMLKMASRIMDWHKESVHAGGTGVAPKMLLQIHDELLFEVVANEEDVNRLKDAVMRCCSEECVREFKLKVPLKLKCSCGTSWGVMNEI